MRQRLRVPCVIDGTWKPRQSRFADAAFTVFAVTVVVAFMLTGVFAAQGIVHAVWEPAVIEAVSGKPPDRSHPAFWTFMLLMPPLMLINALGAVGFIVVPLSYALRVRPSGTRQHKRWFWRYAMMWMTLARAMRVLRH